MINQARNFAQQAHGKQAYGAHPYVYHLDMVAGYLSAYGELAQVIAYLHDVVEDTEVSLQSIEATFGCFVAECVNLLSDEPAPTRQERKAKSYQKLATVTGDAELALIVKVADRIANVKTCILEQEDELFAIYVSEQAVFKASAYRPGLCDELWQQLEALFSSSIFVAPPADFFVKPNYSLQDSSS